MLCCLNPDCDRPINPDRSAYCDNCGVPLVSLLYNRFKVVEPIGRGGFSKTYLAEDVHKLNEHCVIKQLAYEPGNTWAAKKASDLFEQEAKQLQQLGEHPQIPTLLAYFQEGSYLYLAQQFIAGHNLLTELRERGNFSEAQILDLLRDILPVLQFVHERKVIHRDIKPENIMRCQKDNKLVLIDFGVAKLIPQTVIGNSIGNSMLGTYGYAPLEQLKEGRAVYPSDFYALGATCFHLLCGISPYQLWMDRGYGWMENWQQYLLNPIDPKLVLVLDKLLQKDAQQRYQSAKEVLQDLPTQSVALNSSPSTIPTVPFFSSHLPAGTVSLSQFPNHTVPAGSKQKKGLAAKSTLIISIASILLVGCGIAFTQKDRIPFLCNSLGTCIGFTEAYEKASLQAKEAIARNKAAKTIQDIQGAIDLLESSTTNLRTIPAKAKFYPDILQQIATNQQILKEIEDRQVREQQAQLAFNAAQSIAKEVSAQPIPANESFDVAKQRLQDSKGLWQKAIDRLNSIPQNSLFAAQKKAQAQAYRSKIAGIDRQIAALVPPQLVEIAPASPSYPSRHETAAEPTSPAPAVNQPTSREPVRSEPPETSQPPVWGPASPDNGKREPVW